MMYLGQNAVGIATLKELDGFFEVVHRFTPAENESRHTIPIYGPGLYIICEDPLLTLDRAAALNYPSYSLIAIPFTIYKTSASAKYIVRAGASITTLGTSGYTDFWGSYCALNEDATLITVGTSASNTNVGNFLTGHNYIVLKTAIGGDT